MSNKIMHNCLSVPNMIIYVKVFVIVLVFTLDIIQNGVKAQNTETIVSKTGDSKPPISFFFNTLGHQNKINQQGQIPFGPLNLKPKENEFTSFLNMQNQGNPFAFKENPFALKGFTIANSPVTTKYDKKTDDTESKTENAKPSFTFFFKTLGHLDENSKQGHADLVSSENNEDKFEDVGKSSDCELSITIVNQKRVCRNRVIFEDNFSEFDKSKWSKEQFIPSYSTANEIMVFNYFNESNIDVVDGRLTISPTIVDDQIVRGGHLKLEPCTGTIPDECDKKAQYQWILPPVASGRVSTKNSFAFKYGQVEVKAKVPKGDWLVPELWLVPKNPTYGPGLESGRISMIMTRGNRVLYEEDGTDLSFKVLESSMLMSSGGKTKSRTLRIKSEEPWHFHYNKYLFTWRPDEMTVSVNGVVVGNLLFRNLTGSLANLAGFTHEEEKKWSRGSAIAPFDQEFYLSFGLSVGGREFPDNSVSGSYNKPWKSASVKEMLDFWKAKDKWAPTWNENYPKLKILQVKVRSL